MTKDLPPGWATPNLPPPAVLAAEIAEDLQSALAEIQALTEALNATAGREAQD